MNKVMGPSQTRKGHASYSTAFKKKAVKLATSAPSVMAAARQLNIPAANLYYWLNASRSGSSQKKSKPTLPRTPKQRRTYGAEFKLRAVQKATESDAIAATARELKIALQTLHNWVEAAKAGRLGVAISLTDDELKTVQQLCADRIVRVTTSTIPPPDVARKELDILHALSSKLKRLPQ